MNFRFVGHLLAVVILVIGAGIAVSAGVSALYGDDDVPALLISTAIALGAGAALFFSTRLTSRTQIGYREGFLSVGLGWIAAMVFGAVPFVIYGMLGPVDALFESMSGFTTTGASVLTDYDQPHGIMFWRSLTHWFGGMGIIVLFIAVLRPLGAGAMRLFSAESPGPVTERLTPRIRDTARNLWLIYTGITLLQIVLLVVFGMDFFDAFCHAFATMGTGGFSTREASVGAFDSLPLELIIVVFMWIAGGNFALYYAVVRGQAKRLYRSPEFLTYTAIMAVSTIAIAISLMLARSHFSLGHALRESLFQVSSIQTTTGFATADFNLWNSFSKMALVLLMFVGGCAGSTAGGLKVARIILLAKSSRNELTRQMHPQAVLPLKVGGRVVPESIGRNVLGYLVIYLLVFLAGSLLISMTNVDLVTSTTSVAATLNNIGPGLELVGPAVNYSFMDPFAKVVLIVMMVVGRLEIFAILLPFTRAFWRR